jgi:hypothetical protein
MTDKLNKSYLSVVLIMIGAAQINNSIDETA